jgi:hypothetical protein
MKVIFIKIISTLKNAAINIAATIVNAYPLIASGSVSGNTIPQPAFATGLL